MMDLLKRTVLLGIGATVLTKERVEGALNDLVEKGRLSSQEARETADRIMQEGREEVEATRGEIQKSFKELLHKADVVTREEYDALAARVSALEAAHAEAPAE